MRVIAGLAKGIPLKAPKGMDTRPTTDRVRESVFAILGNLEGARVLDLFAGTGALGIEALSRGAEQALFVEKDRRVSSLIRANLEKTKLAAGAKVLAVDSLRLLAKPGKFLGDGFDSFNLVFLDPPYASGLYQPALSALASCGFLESDSLLVVEQSSKAPPLTDWAGFVPFRSERYGDTVVTFCHFSAMEEKT